MGTPKRLTQWQELVEKRIEKVLEHGDRVALFTTTNEVLVIEVALSDCDCEFATTDLETNSFLSSGVQFSLGLITKEECERKNKEATQHYEQQHRETELRHLAALKKKYESNTEAK